MAAAASKIRMDAGIVSLSLDLDGIFKLKECFLGALLPHGHVRDKSKEFRKRSRGAS